MTWLKILDEAGMGYGAYFLIPSIIGAYEHGDSFLAWPSLTLLVAMVLIPGHGLLVAIPWRASTYWCLWVLLLGQDRWGCQWLGLQQVRGA